MKEYRADNPVHDMGNAVAELHKAADMAEIIIEAIFNGDEVTLQMVGNGMELFLSQLRERIAAVEDLNGRMERCFSWIYHFRGGDTDTYCRREFEEYISGRKEAGHEPECPGTYGVAPAFMKLLPEEQQERIRIMLKEAEDVSRMRGFAEGYKAAVGRCAGNGGEGSGSA